jgi:hypothetical protein
MPGQELTQGGVYGQFVKQINPGFFMLAVLSEEVSEVCGPKSWCAGRRLKLLNGYRVQVK